MPRNDQSVFHKVRMMNQGEDLLFPESDYSKIRTTASTLKKLYGAVIKYHVFTDTDGCRKVKVRYPTEAELIKLEKKKKRGLLGHKKSMTYSLEQIKLLCKEQHESISKWLPSELKYVANDTSETK